MDAGKPSRPTCAGKPSHRTEAGKSSRPCHPLDGVFDRARKLGVTRRRFLKVAGIGTGAALLPAALRGPDRSGAAAALAAEEPVTLERIPTFCDICFWKCGAIATVRNGRLWKVEGNPEDPLSRGRLCPRGTGGVGAHYDPDRLQKPLLRKGARGQEQWAEVSWDEALDYIAEKMWAIREQYGPESVALFSHGIGGNFLKHTLKAYGSPNIAAPSFAQCRGPRDVGFELTFGEGVSSPERTDIANAQCLVLIGSHLGENMHNTQVQEFADAIGNGASIIVVDPRFSVAASKARWYLPIRPGTDLALLLAWMNVIVTEHLYDAEYVARYGFGFDVFGAHVRSFTPEWAYPETGIEPEVIRATAREMARHRPATLVHPGRHATWYGDDAQRSRAIALLNALLGSWGRKGGFYTPVSMTVPPYPYPPYPKPARGKVDNPNRRYPFASEAVTTGIREATITGDPYPVKGWFVYATNLLQALPNEEETLRAIQNLDLLVVVDVVPSEIAGWADVILPEAVYLERYDDLNVEWFKEPFVALRQPVVAAPQDQKPNWWIARELAARLGLASFYPWKDIEEYLETRLQSAGLSLAELAKKGIVRGERQPIYFTRTRALEAGGAVHPVPATRTENGGRDTTVSHAVRPAPPGGAGGGTRTGGTSTAGSSAGAAGPNPALPELAPVPSEDDPAYGIEPNFPTPTGKIEFYSPQLAEAGFDPIPVFRPPAPGPAGAFRLLYGRAPVHSFSRTQTNPVLHEMMSENEVWVNVHMADRLALTNGQRVRLRNQDGVVSAPVRVRATEAIRPDCVYMVHGFGHSARGLRRTYGRGASDAQLLTRYVVDPLMGGTGMNVNFVTLEPAGEPGPTQDA